MLKAITTICLFLLDRINLRTSDYENMDSHNLFFWFSASILEDFTAMECTINFYRKITSMELFFYHFVLRFEEILRNRQPIILGTPTKKI